MGEVSSGTRAWLAAHDEAIRRLARVGQIEAHDGAPPKGAIHLLVGDALGSATFFLPLADVIDLDAEKARIEKRIAKLDQEIAKYDRKLADKKFTSRAPGHVIEEQSERRDGLKLDRDRLAESLKQLLAAMKG
jgi:valyl-tRNA synthetase